MKKNIDEFFVEIDVYKNEDKEIKMFIKSEKKIKLLIRDICFYDDSKNVIYSNGSFCYTISLNNSWKEKIIESPKTDKIAKVGLTLRNRENNIEHRLVFDL